MQRGAAKLFGLFSFQQLYLLPKPFMSTRPRMQLNSCQTIWLPQPPTIVFAPETIYAPKSQRETDAK